MPRIERANWQPLAIAPGAETFIPLVIGGYLRLLATLGLYRFWLVRDLRAWYRAHILIAGDPLEYTGTAREHLTGFLIGFAIALPINLVFFFGTLVLGVTWGEVAVWAAVLVLNVLGAYAAYRAERYRLSRTRWHGIAFGLDGSAWRFAWITNGWLLVTVLTVGLAYPWLSAASIRYRLNHVRFGSLAGSVEITGRALFRRWLAFWALGLALSGALVVASVYATYTWFFPGEQIENMSAMIWASIALGLAMIAFMAVWPLYAVYEWRMAMNTFRFGPMRFRSAIAFRDIARSYAIYAVIGGMTLAIWFFAQQYLMPDPEDATLAAKTSGMLITFGLGLAAAYVFGISYELLVARVFWRAALETTEHAGLDDALEMVEAVPVSETATGQGFLEALDL